MSEILSDHETLSSDGNEANPNRDYENQEYGDYDAWQTMSEAENPLFGQLQDPPQETVFPSQEPVLPPQEAISPETASPSPEITPDRQPQRTPNSYQVDGEWYADLDQIEIATEQGKFEWVSYLIENGITQQEALLKQARAKNDIEKTEQASAGLNRIKRLQGWISDSNRIDPNNDKQGILAQLKSLHADRFAASSDENGEQQRRDDALDDTMAISDLVNALETEMVRRDPNYFGKDEIAQDLNRSIIEAEQGLKQTFLDGYLDETGHVYQVPANGARTPQTEVAELKLALARQDAATFDRLMNEYARLTCYQVPHAIKKSDFLPTLTRYINRYDGEVKHQNQELERLIVGSREYYARKTVAEKAAEKAAVERNSAQRLEAKYFSPTTSENIPKAPLRSHISQAAKEKIVSRYEENFENFSGNVLDITIQGSRYAFSTIDSFNPIVMGTSEPSQLSTEIRNVLKAQTHSPDTLQRTYEDPEWSPKIFQIVENAMSNPNLQNMLGAEKIEDLRHLSPRQAVVLTTDLVAMVTKYNKSIADVADTKTAMDLLQDGLEHYADPNWAGNGVCRNFASITQAIFESLKSHQDPSHSLLNDTYCVTRASWKHEDFMPYDTQREIGKSQDEEGHAWNDFIQVSNDGTSAAVMSLDVTWGKFDLDTKQVVGLERTEIRTSVVINSLLKDYTKLLERKEVNQLMNYYGSTVSKIGMPPRSIEDMNTAAFCGHQIVKVLDNAANRRVAINDNIDNLTSAADVFAHDYVRDFGPSELETLCSLYREDEAKSTRNMLIDAFIRTRSSSPQDLDSINFGNDTSLQAEYQERLALYRQNHPEKWEKT